MLTMRGHPVVLLMDEDLQDCYVRTWKTQRKTPRKGRELDATYFNVEEQTAVREAVILPGSSGTHFLPTNA